MEGGGDSGKDDTSEKDMEEEEEECKIQIHFLTTKEQRYHLCCYSEHQDSGCYWKTVE